MVLMQFLSALEAARKVTTHNTSTHLEQPLRGGVGFVREDGLDAPDCALGQLWRALLSLLQQHPLQAAGGGGGG